MANTNAKPDAAKDTDDESKRIEPPSRLTRKVIELFDSRHVYKVLPDTRSWVLSWAPFVMTYPSGMVLTH